MTVEDQRVADATRLNTQQNLHPLTVTFDDGMGNSERPYKCMSFCHFDEKYILVKEPLGSGKSYQARTLRYERICQLTTSRTLASETAKVAGCQNFQDIDHCNPLSYINKLLVLAPRLYRLQHEFKSFDCLVRDKCESLFEDLITGLCREGKL